MDYNTEVKLLSITPDAEQLCEIAGRLCYSSGDKLGTNDKWLESRIKQGHQTIIEHGSASFYIKASRVFSHEIVRHRIANYSQRSQRYVKESEPDYILPPEFENDENALKVFRRSMIDSWISYKYLLDKGYKPEIARYVIPNACMTEIICTWNFREIRHIIELRTSNAALPEMREVAGKIKDIIKEKCPKIFGDLK